MDSERLILGVAAVLAGVTVVLAVLALAVRQLFLLFVALPFGVATYFMWYHATGRLEARTRRRAAAGPDARAGPAGGRTDGFGRRSGAGTPTSAAGLSREEAFRTLGLSPDATPEDVKRAYRRRVKEVHPDAEGGSEESFKAVKRAYERLSE